MGRIDVFYVHYVIDDILFAFFPIISIPFDVKVPFNELIWPIRYGTANTIKF